MSFGTASLGTMTVAGKASLIVDGLILSLMATSGLYDATSGGSLVTTDNSAVARWEDQSGNSNHATQSTSGLRPILKTSIKNGLPVIRFDSDSMVFASSIGGSEYSVFIVCANSDPDDGSIIFKTSSAATYIGIITDTGYNVNGRNKFILAGNDAGSGGSGSLAFSGGTAGSNFIVGSCLRGASVANGGIAYLNNVSGINVGTISGSQTYTGLGGYGSGLDLKGDIGEIAVYNRAVTNNERLIIESYFNEKWGVY
jgi:hypothetical protein